MTSTTRQREKLTRDRIVDAALAVMDAEGLDAVSMRRVAREVGVDAMSLYHHVRDKDALLQAVCDRVMAGFEFPSDEGSWEDRCKAAARSWRRGSNVSTLRQTEAAMSAAEVLRSDLINRIDPRVVSDSPMKLV